MATLGRRDWLKVTTVSALTAGAVAGSVPFIQSLAPQKDAPRAKTEVDLASIPPGKSRMVACDSCAFPSELPPGLKGSTVPVLIVHRTKEMIESARGTETTIHPENDVDRVTRPEWLVVTSICTHLGCIPNFEPREGLAFKCPCHGSEYDYSGRITMGPGRLNLFVPTHEFIADNKLVIG